MSDDRDPLAADVSAALRRLARQGLFAEPTSARSSSDLGSTLATPSITSSKMDCST